MRRFFQPMTYSRRRLRYASAPLLGASCLAAAIGCSSGPSRVEPPSIDAGGAASQAMETYDKDGDGAIAGAELDAATSLKASMATLDTNKDGKVQEDEIVARIEAWQATGIGATLTQSRVTLDGKPVAGAQVTFEPEPFLGDEMRTAIGETSANGIAIVSVPKEQRARPDWPAGIQLGFFKVRINKEVNGQESIPAQFNKETILGQQVAPDDPALQSQLIKLDMKTK